MQPPSIPLGRDDLRQAASQRLLGERLRCGKRRAPRGCADGTVGVTLGALAMAGAALPARPRDCVIERDLLWKYVGVRQCAHSVERCGETG